MRDYVAVFARTWELDMIQDLRGVTVYITGASRGIGEAIALRCARDGANIVLAARTAEPHNTLPGTIYSVAKAVEATGGRALPTVVDVRDEMQVQASVRGAVEAFGGIDVLVNCASYVRLTGTADTTMKAYDLMFDVIARGTFLCTQACLPYLMSSQRPQILNICPPLSLRRRWLTPHIPYTAAKYSVSLFVLGMAAELATSGVAVTGLWPKTLIATSAMNVVLGDEMKLRRCRKPAIMADAAYELLTSARDDYKGKLLLDEDILRESGICDFASYRVDPDVAESDLIPDGYVD